MAYVYKVVDRVTGEYYIGFRSAHKVAPEFDLWVKYFTSSRIVKSKIDCFDPSIIEIFDSAQEAYDYEQLLIYENWEDPLMINKSCYHNKKAFKQSDHLSEDHKLNISKATKGRVFSDEHKQKLAKAKLGKPLSEETKKKMSEVRTGRSHSDSTKDKISAKHKGRRFSDDHKRKLSEAARNRRKSTQ